jgi:hypothetical protein
MAVLMLMRSTQEDFKKRKCELNKERRRESRSRCRLRIKSGGRICRTRGEVSNLRAVVGLMECTDSKPSKIRSSLIQI